MQICVEGTTDGPERSHLRRARVQPGRNNNGYGMCAAAQHVFKSTDGSEPAAW